MALEYLHRVPKLQPATCQGLMAKEYWYRGNLRGDAGVLFLKLSDTPWHRFFIDSGAIFWKTVSEPDPPEEFEEYRYALADIGRAHGLIGRKLTKVTPVEFPGGGEIRLEFGFGDVTLVLRNLDCRSTLVIERRETAR